MAAMRRKESERGSAMVEFALTSLVWLPLMLGTAVFGFNVVRAIQVSQLSRDTGHMYAYGIDFSQPQNVTILSRMAAPLKVQQSSGNGAVVLSKITYVTDSDCQAAGPSNPCYNRNQYVFTDFFVFGNRGPDYAQTKLGSPSSAFFPSGRTIQQNDYLNDPSLIATNFKTYLQFDTKTPGQYAFVSEVTLHPDGLSWDGFSDLGSYARSIF
jgi:hypothetical protein